MSSVELHHLVDRGERAPGPSPMLYFALGFMSGLSTSGLMVWGMLHWLR